MLKFSSWIKPSLILILISLIFSSFFCSYRGGDVDDQKLINLVAFAKLYGYIRYFHPGDEAAMLDWNEFLLYGIRQIVKAKNTDELKETLEELFLPIAPSIRLFKTSDNPKYDLSIITPFDTSGLKKVYWQHKGIGFEKPESIYKSIRVNRKGTSGNEFGTIRQFIEAGDFKGKKIKLTAAVMTEVNGYGNQGQLWLRVDRQNNKTEFSDNMSNKPITSNKWKVYEITGEVAEDASVIYFGCLLNGTGKVWADDFRFYVSDPVDKWKEVHIKDNGFEEDSVGAVSKLWGSDYDSFNFSVTDDRPFEGRKCVCITSLETSAPISQLFDDHPDFGETITKKISDELICSIPLVLYSDLNGTFPHSDKEKLKNFLAKVNVENPDFSADNKYVRLADIVVCWNIFEHFYPYFDVMGINWSMILTEYLKKAYNDSNENQFYTTLRMLVAELKDGHGRVTFNKDVEYFYPGIGLDYVQNKVVVCSITKNEQINLDVGDILTEIDGVKLSDKIDELSKTISSATPQWKMKRLIHEELLRGKEGSEVKLKITKDNGIEEFAVCKRVHSYEEYFTEISRYQENRPPRLVEVKPGIMYVNLELVSMGELDSSMIKLSQANGIIFDLRGYPNGNHYIINHLIDKPVTSPRWNIPQIINPDMEKIVGYDTSGRWLLEPQKPHLNAKMVFLTNGAAISYAESFMGIIEAYRLAEIVGEPTAGTNGNINSFSLMGGFNVIFTGMKVLKHDGSQHHGIGIQPTIPISRTIQGVKEGRDELLEKAIEVIEKNIKK